MLYTVYLIYVNLLYILLSASGFKSNLCDTSSFLMTEPRSSTDLKIHNTLTAHSVGSSFAYNPCYKGLSKSEGFHFNNSLDSRGVSHLLVNKPPAVRLCQQATKSTWKIRWQRSPSSWLPEVCREKRCRTPCSIRPARFAGPTHWISE